MSFITALVYPSDRTEERLLGTQDGGLRVRVFTFDVRDPPASAADILSKLVPDGAAVI